MKKRTFFYIFLGLIAGLIGIVISQFLLLIPIPDSLPKFFDRAALFIFPITTITLTVSMVWAEIFLNNPTRFKQNRDQVKEPTLKAIWLGLGIGLLVAFFLIGVGYIPFINEVWIKLIGWLFIGGAVGLADGITWQLCTIEGSSSQKERVNKYKFKSIRAGLVAGFVAFFISKLPFFSSVENIIGFIVLGVVLGFALSLTSGASLCYALRAGTGFELDEDNSDFPVIQSEDEELSFNFKSPYAREEDGTKNRIEEGISIELPSEGAITIGSDKNSHIKVPVLIDDCAVIKINKREVSIKAKGENIVFVDDKPLEYGQSKILKHNQILTFIKNPDKSERIDFVRFVFYDRFLDRQA